MIYHRLPDEAEIEISLSDVKLFQDRIADVHKWFKHDDVATKNRDLAKKLFVTHKDLKGYADVHKSYTQDENLAARIDEMVIKSAFYDVLHSRKASISFSDTAGAATSATSPRATGSENAHRKTPPSESPASTPRLAAVDSEGSDVQARKSFLMEKARTAKTEDERQNFLKQAIKLGPSRLSAVVRR
jgi:dTDP-4-dehydrorhamnose reductase